MGWQNLAQLTATGLVVWSAALAAVIAWRILWGGASLLSLLRETIYGSIRSDRVQMAAVTALAALTYLVRGAGALGAGGAHHTLPDLPDSLAVLVTGSQAIYLGGKLGRRNPRHGRENP